MKAISRARTLAWACALALVISIAQFVIPGDVPELGASVRPLFDPVAMIPVGRSAVLLRPRLSERSMTGGMRLAGAPAMVKPSSLPHPLWEAPTPAPTTPVLKPMPTPPPPSAPIAEADIKVDHPAVRPAPPPPSNPAPTPPPSAAPTATPTPPDPTPPPAAPRVDRLTSSDGTLDVPVGIYNDCSGETALSYDHAAVDPCMRNVDYFVGHNPGVFAPLTHMGPGSRLTWWDHTGAAHAYRVSASRDMAANAPRTRTSADVVAQFQTCITNDGSVDRILDAVPA